MMRTLLAHSLRAAPFKHFRCPETNLVFDEQWAVAYSGFRKGQHPDRGFGAKNPTYMNKTLEDLEILLEYDFKLIRLYDSGENSKMVLDVIRDNNLYKSGLGAWLDAEISNHDRCGWLNRSNFRRKLKENIQKNKAEVNQAIQLCRNYKREIITAVSIGNKAQIFWHDHTVHRVSLKIH